MLHVIGCGDFIVPVHLNIVINNNNLDGCVFTGNGRKKLTHPMCSMLALSDIDYTVMDFTFGKKHNESH